MKNILLSITLVAFFAFVIGGDGNSVASRQIKNCPLRSANEKLTNYFELRKIVPAHIVNNLDQGEWRSQRALISIGRHKVEFTNTVNRSNSTFDIRVDAKRISLDGLESANSAEGDSKISASMVDEWQQVRLYQLDDRSLIGITLRPRTCTGLSCSVAAQLYYDLTTGKATLFGTFRADDEAQLYRLTNDVGYYHMSKRFDGDPHGNAEFSLTYNAYELKKNGDFEIRKGNSGNPVYLKLTMFPNAIEPYTLQKLNEGNADKLEQDWIERID